MVSAAEIHLASSGVLADGDRLIRCGVSEVVPRWGENYQPRK